ncbi:MAG TPA: DUF1203 domain-containing protein [Hyphomonadaceae bacterium]|jgi:hypothetical protein|nr:DUF1203 domain-containing protein [Hyphomonadaceae bacterium]
MFRISALPVAKFSHLFGKSDEELRALGVIASVADGPGSPCRVAMRDAVAGERVLLMNHQHQDADTPFRASHAIYVIDGAEEAFLEPGETPEVMASRLLSVRAFSRDGMMIDADVVDGASAGEAFERMLSMSEAAYLHAHYAKFGCYAARVERA